MKFFNSVNALEIVASIENGLSFAKCSILSSSLP
jgi:hypothetical protein